MYFCYVNGGELFSVTNQQKGFDPSSSSGNGSSSQSDFDFEGAPIFTNNDIGVTAYPQQDKNGNWYLSVSLPIIGSFNMFVNNGPHEGLEESFNKLVNHFNGK